MDVPVADTLARMAETLADAGVTHCDRMMLCWMEGTRLRTLHTAIPADVLALMCYELGDDAAVKAPMPSRAKH